jgi:HEPN domain-containing protein
MNVIQISDWTRYLRDGEQFLKTARSAYLKHKKGFSHEALYNLTCMGIEKLIMAFLMKNGDLAENHTMEDLLRAMDKHLTPDSDIADKLLFLGSFQEICELDSYVVKKPSGDDIRKILQIGDDLHYHLAPHLY